MNIINKKGQALIEFVIILPILIFLILSVIDIGIILYNQNELENIMESVVDLYQNNQTSDIKNILDKSTDFSTSNESKYEELALSKNINLITPGLNLVFGDPYTIKVTRVVTNE